MAKEIEFDPDLECAITLADFVSYAPSRGYIFIPTREIWPGASVNSRVPRVDELKKEISATGWLDKNRSVEQMTWAPGMQMLIRDFLVADGGWIERKGVTCFNLYRPPTIIRGTARNAQRWIEHVNKIYPVDATHIVQWLAHRVQKPQEKINHALVLGGSQGIGKDSLLEPVKRAIGPWNFQEASPQQLLGRFNGFLKSVILRVSEARDLGDINRYQFYDHMKSYLAAPPDTLRIDEKNLREYSIINCVGVIITTNHKADGIYLPADDRRHFVAWSDRSKEDFPTGYWNDLWSWYDNGGDRHVAAFLAEFDLKAFDPKAPPPKTPAFWEVVDANRAPEDAELADALDELANPAAVTLQMVEGNTTSAAFLDWIKDRRNRRSLPYRFERCGYQPIRNDTAKDGLWKIRGKRQVIYARITLSTAEQLKAARALVKGDPE